MKFKLKLITGVVFFLEVWVFVISGYLLAIRNIWGFITLFIIGLVIAYIVGKLIEARARFSGSLFSTILKNLTRGDGSNIIITGDPIKK